MKNYQIKKNWLDGLSLKVKMSLVSIVDEFYALEKKHTVVVMPFFGLLHIQGNESKPILNYADLNVLDLMKSQFKDVVVYAGENPYLDSYGLTTSVVEHLVFEQNILSRIVNRTTNFNEISHKHNEILCLYEEALANFEDMKKKYPLPYRTDFNVETPENLISFVNDLDKKIKQEDRQNKICLICPISYLTNHQSEVYESIKKMMKEIGGVLYFAQNQSDIYLYNNIYRLLYDEQYEERFIQSIQDFANKYNEDVTILATEQLQFNEVLTRVKRGDYGTSEKEIIKNLEQIDVQALYSNKNCSNEQNFMN